MSAIDGVADFQRVLSESLDAAREFSEKIKDIRGVGYSADETVSVTVSAGGELVDIELDPRVMRLDTLTLRELLLDAAGKARTDAADQMSAMSQEFQQDAGQFFGRLGLDQELGRLTNGFSRDPADAESNLRLLQEKIREGGR